MRVSTIHLRALIEAFETHGRRASELLAERGIPRDVLSDGYTWISIEAFDGLLCAAAELTSDPAFGLNWAERSAMHQFDLLPPLVISASNLRAGVECLLQFQQILGDRPELLFEERSGRARFHFKPFAISAEGTRVRADFAVAAFARLLKYVGAADEQIEYIAFEHARPAYEREYQRIFTGRSVRFGEAFCGIQFDGELLDKPLLMQNPVLHRALDQQARSVRTLVLGGASLHERIQEQLRSALPVTLDMHCVARALGLSERSLRRRLESEGYTYSALVERTKQDLSLELLGDLSRPIKEIAGQLGFANVRTFHRAFRRWTHSTPSAYRRQLSRTA
jgi:AraC-like DNA-binding protein